MDGLTMNLTTSRIVDGVMSRTMIQTIITDGLH